MRMQPQLDGVHAPPLLLLTKKAMARLPVQLPPVVALVVVEVVLPHPLWLLPLRFPLVWHLLLPSQ